MTDSRTECKESEKLNDKCPRRCMDDRLHPDKYFRPECFDMKSSESRSDRNNRSGRNTGLGGINTGGNKR